MATQPPHDDDQAKKPDEAQQPPKTPTSKKPPVPNMELDEPEEVLIVDEVIEEEAIPVLEVVDDEPLVLAESDVIDAEVVEAVPASEVVEVAPASEVVLADEALKPHPADSPPMMSQPRTGVRTTPLTPLPTVVANAPVETAPAPTSDVDLMQMFEEPIIVAGPKSAPELEEVVEAAPASDVIAAEEVVEHSQPLSDVVAEEIVEEAMPASEIKAEDEVLGVEEIADAEPASEPKSAELFVDAVEEPSSATRKAEAVLDDEILEAEEAEVVATGSSAVLFDELVEAKSGVKMVESGSKKKTIPLESPSSGAKTADEDLVTDEELVGSSEASAVDLSDVPSRKGSSVVGIDKLAEALESGVELNPDSPMSPEPVEVEDASVEFDEALEDDSEEHAVHRSKSKMAAAADDGSTEMEAEPMELLGAKGDSTVSKKKGKMPAPVDDEVDLESLFGDDEAESAHPREKAADHEATVAFDKADEAEAAEIFGEEPEAAESLADDEVDLGAVKPAKASAKNGKGKKSALLEDDDAEATEAMDDEDESAARKKKKNGKKKELAAVAPPEKRPSMALRWLGGMFVGGLLAIAAVGAAVMFAPGEIEKLVKTTPEKKPIDPGLAANAKEARELAEKLKVATLAKDTAEKDLKKATADKEKAENDNKAVADVLAKGKVISDKGTFDAAALEKALKDFSADKAALDSVNKLLKDAEVNEPGAKGVKTVLDNRKEAEDKLTAATKVADAVNKLLKDADVKDAGDKGVKSVLDAKKDADEKLTAVNKALEDEKIKDQGAKGILALADARNKTAKERDDLLASITAAVKEFADAKIVPADGDPRKQLVEGAKLARLKSESPLAISLAQLGQQLSGVGASTGKLVEKTFDTAKLAAELGFYKAREPLIESPQQKMDTDVALLQDRTRNNPKELAAMTREADWVLAPESKSSPEARGKARYVQGLALRNMEKYDEARAAFDDALKLAGGGWTESVKKSKLELTDPNAYYVPRIVAYGDQGQFNSAFAEANTALKVMPADARLFALRALIHFELIRGQGAKTSAADQKAIRADAAAAAKDAGLAAESAYIVGLLDEELGNWTEAEKQFRQALKAHQGNDDAAGRYRVALARLLLRDRPEGAAPVAPPVAPNDEKKDAATPNPVERTIVMHPWSLLAVSIVIAQPGDDEAEDPAMVARLKETIDLANQLIASKTDKIKGQGYLILGSAHSKQGKRTEGIKEYAKGLKLLYPGIESDELAKLVAEHPAFQQPDAGGNDPILAERHFGEGYHLFWARKYPEAEAQFKKAVSLFDKDARYQYYLGLAQYQQKTKAKRDAAYFSWEQGARLEAKAATNPFSVREINASLERVQGNERQLLNSYRYKAAEEVEAK